jgi:hypothetical protein
MDARSSLPYVARILPGDTNLRPRQGAHAMRCGQERQRRRDGARTGHSAPLGRGEVVIYNQRILGVMHRSWICSTWRMTTPRITGSVTCR